MNVVCNRLERGDAPAVGADERDDTFAAAFQRGYHIGYGDGKYDANVGAVSVISFVLGSLATVVIYAVAKFAVYRMMA